MLMDTESVSDPFSLVGNNEVKTMQRIEIEMLSETSNCPVVKTPGRKFPGIILQGDSLKALFDVAVEVRDRCDKNNDELCAAAGELKDRLGGFVAAYEQAMQVNGLELPYPKPTSVK
jgi:hypothetical protein